MLKVYQIYEKNSMNIWPSMHIRVVDFVKSPKLHGFCKFSHLFGPKEFTKWKKFKKFSCLLSPQAGFSFMLWITKGGKRDLNFAQKINEEVKLESK